ncbi:MAG: hypothetical protein WCS13_07060 [Candidatus Cloacimonadaceae bacterium]
MKGKFIDSLLIILNLSLKKYKYFLFIFILLFNNVLYLKANDSYLIENNNMNIDLKSSYSDDKNLRNINIYISEPVYHITYSEECTLNINIEGFNPNQILRGFEIKISYDSTYLTSTMGDIHLGDFLNYFANSSGTTFMISGQDGAWIVTGSVLGIPKNKDQLKDTPTSGTLFSIKLTALSKTSCYNPVYVTLSDIVLRDELNNPIEFDSVSGAEIYIQPTLIIPLKTGWNLISSWVIPESTFFEDIFAELLNENYLVKIQDESGNYYMKDMDGNWQNTIGNYQMGKGYYVLVNNDCELDITGNPIELPVTINLNRGWNIIPYLYHNSQDAWSFISPLVNSGVLLKVQDEEGHLIVKNIGGEWINEISLFEASEAYYIQVSESCQFTYSPEYKTK